MKTPNLFETQGLKALAGNASAVVNHLCNMARENKEEEDYIKVNNSDSYMPVVVEILNRNEHNMLGRLEHVSIAHYGEQNGDLMADPDMEFLLWNPKGNDDAYVFPMSFHNDYVGYSDLGIEINNELVPTKFSKEKVAEYIDFCNMWMNNIREQQGLDIAKK